MEFDPPYALDADGWEEFREKFKKEAPIRFFLTKRVGRFFRRIKWRIERVWDWVAYRTTRRFHVVKTGLGPGYQDVVQTMLYTNFTMLVNFVECEKAWMQIVFDKDAFKEHMGWRRHLPRFLRPKFRNRELGLQNLDWEATLDDPDLPENERCPPQAETARKIKKLYLWWVDERPTRTDIPYPLNEGDGGSYDDPLRTLSTKWKDENPGQSKAIREWGQKTRVMEDAWDAEDSVMLIELVKVRRSLWT